MLSEEAKQLLVLGLIGLPFAVWAHVTLSRQLERMIKRCGNCTVCKAKAEQEAKEDREAKFRSDRKCIRGHGFLNADGRCNTCGWS
jgi:hypothetical protein